MKYHHGVWIYRGQSWPTLRAVLLAVWPERRAA